MRVRRYAILVSTGVLLAGCGLGPYGAEPPGSDGGDGGSTAHVAVQLPLQRTAEALSKVSYKSTHEIPDPGEYIVDLATGEVEGWVLRGEPSDLVRFSENRRWVSAEIDGVVYWVDRESGQGFSWKSTELKVVGEGPRQLLLMGVQEDAGPRSFYVVDHDFQVQYTFSLDLGDLQISQVAFSPAGKHLAIAAVQWLGEGGTVLRVYVVDLGSGSSRELSHPTIGKATIADLWIGASGELVVQYTGTEFDERTGTSSESSVVRRYSWEGELLNEYAVLGRGVSVSQDGRLLVSSQDLDGLASAAVLTDLATGEPVLRVVNAWPIRMAADSATLVVRGGPLGGYYLLTPSGELRLLPYKYEGFMPLYAELLPSPDDPQRLLFGLNVIDPNGNLVQRVDVQDRDEWLVWDSTWGADGREVYVKIEKRIGKGNETSSVPLPIQVQKPPFADPYLLEVQDPEGECVNLREANRRDSPVICCLPNGTRLAVADLWQAPEKVSRPILPGEESHDDIWLWARTEQGEVGWVNLSTGSVTWAQ